MRQGSRKTNSSRISTGHARKCTASGMARHEPPPRVYFDADVIIAGCRSGRGASRVLLRLAEYGLIVGCTSDLALQESERHVIAAPAEAFRQFRRAISNAF